MRGILLLTLLAFAIFSVNFCDVDADDLPRLNFRRILNRSKFSNNKFKRDISSTGLISEQDVLYKATITIGTPPRVFHVLIDTGSSDLWIPDASCIGAGCVNKNKFSSNYSISYGGDRDPWQISYVDQSGASGVTATDTVIVGGFALTDQVFARATGMNSGFQDLQADGIIGLGGTQRAVIPGTITPIETMKNQGFINVRSFGVWLGKASEGGSGEVTFGGFDSSHIVGSLTMIPLASKFDITGVWVVSLSQISVGTLSIPLTLRTGLTVIDTGTSLITAPTTIADKINKVLGGTFSPQAQAYILPCKATPPDMTFTFGTTAFTVPGADLVIEAGQGLCASAILPLDIGGELSFLVGDTFLKNNYAYFNLDESVIGLAQAKR